MDKVSPHFSVKEMSCPCCSVMGMENDVIATIEAVRVEYGKPIRLTSSFRCEKHNEAIGAKATSSHVLGLALDISCDSSRERYGLMRHLMQHFTRIGLGEKFIHVDLDHLNKVPNVIWDYYE
jgi:zinc D-Ala-D-Ala carboxypeptidase